MSTNSLEELPLYLEETNAQEENSPPASPASVCEEDVVTHNKFSYIVYKAFLKYLYTGMIDLPSKKALELLKLADTYGEPNLKNDCTKVIKEIVTVSNIAFVYEKAIKYNSKELENFCFQFALNHMTDVVKLENFA